MLRIISYVMLLAVLATSAIAEAKTPPLHPQGYRCISLSEYRDKMKAGWIGQIAGVSWGAPTEFRFRGVIMPAEKMPVWKDAMINDAFNQDDLYVEMTFLRSLEQYGFDVSQKQAGLDFAASNYSLWHANKAGRDNLRAGIAPPDSGHPKFSKHADDIDYQIEADFSGLVAPGLPNTAIALGDKFGRLMNYGDGLYGGQFMGAMYSEAFFEKDPEKIVRVGLRAIPIGSQYAETVRDVLLWHRQYPDDWEKTWSLVNEKYSRPEYRRASCGKGNNNIDAKMNGAFVVMGLLYGNGDLDKTIVISCRCGQDSDCNPANAAGVLFTAIGYSNLPDRFKSKLNEKSVFSYTAYNFPKLISACERVAREAVARAGGFVAKGANGEEFFVIPEKPAKPGKLEQCWKPGRTANSKYQPGEVKWPDENKKP